MPQPTVVRMQGGGARQFLAAMAAHEAIQTGVPSPECDAFLIRLVAQYPRCITANSQDRGGRVVRGGQGARNNNSLVERRYFQCVMAGQDFALGEYAIGNASGRASLRMAAPLSNAHGQRIGVVVVALSIGWLVQDLLTLPC